MSRNFGVVTNPRIAVLADTVAFPGLQFWHSTSPIYDYGTGETIALLVSGDVAGTGSDGYYQSYPDQSFVFGGGILPQQLVDDGRDWDGNPGNVGGTAFYADAADAAYGDPLRVDFLGLSSTVVTGATGGTLSVATHVPLSMDPSLTRVWINFGDPLRTPFTQTMLQSAFGGFGLTFHGGLGMYAAFSIPARPVGTLAKVEVKVGPIRGMASSHAEAIAFNKATGDVMLSNVSSVIVQ